MTSARRGTVAALCAVVACVACDRPSSSAPSPAVDASAPCAAVVVDGSCVEEPPLHPDVTQAHTLRRAGKLDEAEALASPLRDASDPVTRAQARAVLARISLARGAVEVALQGLADAERSACSAGLAITCMHEALVQADTWRRHRANHVRAREALDRAARQLDAYPAGGAHLAYYRALVERDDGDVRQALASLSSARGIAERYGMVALARDATQVEAVLRFELGDRDGALHMLRTELDRVRRDACARGYLLLNVGWLDMLAAERGLAAPDDTALRDAYATYSGACPNVHEAMNAAVTLAAMALLDERPDDARRWVEAAQAGEAAAPALVQAFALLVHAELALRAGDAREAIARFDEVHRRAQSVASQSLAYRALSGMGRAWEQAGKLDAAEQAYVSAEAMLERELSAVPLFGALDAYAGAREEASLRLMELRVKRGDVAAAFATARALRRRAQAMFNRNVVTRWPEGTPSSMAGHLSELRAVQAELAQLEAGAWSVPRDQLPAFARAKQTLVARKEQAIDRALSLLEPARATYEGPAPGELRLLLTRTQQGVRVFAATDAGIKTELVSLPPTSTEEQHVAALLAPITDELERARTVRVLADATLSSLDVHAYRLHGEPLLAARDVVYGVDVGQPADAGASGRVLVVADPRADLPRALAEGSGVQGALSEARAVDALFGASATAERVRSRLSSADAFYYAGHSEVSGGIAGAMLLAGGDRLEAADVLALPRVPSQVILSSCDSATTRPEGRARGVSIAEAFVLRGARAVLATSRPVADAAAASLSRALLDEDALRGGPVPLVRALRRTLRDDTTGAWTSYRVLVP